MTLVSFVVINCNRLFYLKSCVESLLRTTADYEKKELVVIDNASVESGTKDYLSELEHRGFRIVARLKRDPANEFASALNLGVAETKGEIVFPIQGDTQFIWSDGWLREYVALFNDLDDSIGCVMLDAQRRSRVLGGRPYGSIMNHSNFFFDSKRNPVNCAGDCAYSRRLLEKVGPWRTENLSHEGGNDSETDMLNRVQQFMKRDESLRWRCVVPRVPPSVGIFTDCRGTMARCRGNKRYGDYWEAKDSSKTLYYELLGSNDRERLSYDKSIPLSIEEVARPIGFLPPIDEKGNWLKNPIRPETALPSDYVVLYDDDERSPAVMTDQALDDWMSST